MVVAYEQSLAPAPVAPAAEPILSVRNLAMRYANGREALRGVDLEVGAGELVIVLGSNGSGKSTLLQCIVRLLTPSAGAFALPATISRRYPGRRCERPARPAR